MRAVLDTDCRRPAHDSTLDPVSALQVAAMYNWDCIATRTVRGPYAGALACRHSSALHHRLPRLLAVGRVAGPLAVAMASLDLLWYCVVCLWRPECDIDPASSLQTSRTDR